MRISIVGPCVAATVVAAFGTIAQAFSRSFDRLTAACNSCHRAADLGFIVIRVPIASPPSNQSFDPNRE